MKLISPAALALGLPLIITQVLQCHLASGFKLTILHTNDFHSRFEETNQYGALCTAKDAATTQGCYGGVARKATAIKQIRAQVQNVVLLSAGDVFTGTLWYKVYRGNATWKVMNQMGYDAMTLGNHDFDDGAGNTARFVRNIKCPVIVSNVNCSREPAMMVNGKPLILNSKVLTVGGEKIGLVGFVTQNTPRISNPGPGPNLKFSPEVEAVTSAVADLKRQGINKIIAIGHAGISKDKEVARLVGDVDVVVGGHSHTFLYTGKPPTNDVPQGPYPVVVESSASPGKKVPVVHAYKFGKFLGRLDVEFDNEGKLTQWSGKPVLLDKTVVKDRAMELEVQAMKGKVDDLSGEKIGRTLVYLNADRPACRLRECNLGNLVTDAMVAHYANQTATAEQWTEASIGLQNSGVILASIDVTPQGHVTYGDLFNSLPYGNTFDIVELRGVDLKALMEQSIAQYSTVHPSGSFFQVSGLKLLYDVSKPTGQRVVSIEVLCAKCRVPVYQPLKLTAIYKVITNSWIAGGGSGFSVFKDKKLSHVKGSVDSDVVWSYIESNGPITIGREGRIKFVSDSNRDVVSGSKGLMLDSVLLAFVLSFLVKTFLSQFNIPL